MPQSAEMIIEKLTDRGFEAYIVGGCVRDCLLKRTPLDFDITTSALPQEIINTFKGYTIIPTGLKHGTVTIVIKGEPFEVTTYRIDGDYSDGRRPNEVSFTSSLFEDLGRRDFTINAMAYNHENGLIDYFGGTEDLEKGIIRCVGNAEERFSEDYLRMLRAYRFEAVLRFEMEASVKQSAIKNRANILKISAERIRVEFDKILLSDNFPKIKSFLEDYSDTLFPDVYKMKGVIQNNPFHCFDVYDHTMEVIKNTDTDLIMRLSALFHDTGKPPTLTTDENGANHFYNHARKSAEIVSSALKALKYDNHTHDVVFCIVKYHDYNFKYDTKSIKKLLGHFGEDMSRRFLDFYYSDTMGKSDFAKEKKLPHIELCKNALDQVIASGEPFAIKDLAINGKEIMEILHIKPGKEVGQILSYLLEQVVAEPELNTKEKLINLMYCRGDL